MKKDELEKQFNALLIEEFKLQLDKIDKEIAKKNKK